MFGNPLLYTDPTGYVSKFSEFFIDNSNTIITTAASIAVFAGVFIATGGLAAPVSAAAISKVASAGIYAAMASSATSGALGTALNGGSFGDCLIAGTKGAIFGGMSAMAAVGIGDKFKEIGLIAKSKFLTEAARAGAHSVTQGAIAVFRGGDFWQGAASGALGSIGVSIYGGDNLWITVAIGSVSAGAGAVIGGAETAEEILFGMATGAIVGALNHYLHEAGDPDPDDVKLTNRIRRKMENSPTVQRISQSVFDENGTINKVIQHFDMMGNKVAGIASDVIDIVTFYVDEIMPTVNNSLNREYNAYKGFATPYSPYRPHYVTQQEYYNRSWWTR